MSNLNNNTTQLELLLAKVNALPEAGGAVLRLHKIGINEICDKRIDDVEKEES